MVASVGQAASLRAVANRALVGVRQSGLADYQSAAGWQPAHKK
jgi:hypothetical protein